MSSRLSLTWRWVLRQSLISSWKEPEADPVHSLCSWVSRVIICDTEPSTSSEMRLMSVALPAMLSVLTVKLLMLSPSGGQVRRAVVPAVPQTVGGIGPSAGEFSTGAERERRERSSAEA